MKKLILLLIFSALTSPALAQDEASDAAPPPESASEPDYEIVPRRNEVPDSGRPETHRLRFAAGAGLALGGVARWSEVKDSSQVFNRTTDMTFGSAVNLTAEARFMAANTWGLTGGIFLEGEHRASEWENGGIRSSTDAKIQVNGLFFNVVYQWTNWYLPFGVHFANVKFTPDSSSGANWDHKGGGGIQFGAGYKIDDNWAIEGLSRSTGIELTSTAGANKVEYGMGTFTTVTINGKYTF